MALAGVLSPDLAAVAVLLPELLAHLLLLIGANFLVGRLVGALFSEKSESQILLLFYTVILWTFIGEMRQAAHSLCHFCPIVTCPSRNGEKSFCIYWNSSMNVLTYAHCGTFGRIPRRI